MTSIRRSLAVGVTALIMSSTGVFAQAGGSDVPKDAKKQGEKEIPGSTGTSKDGGAMTKSGDAMEKKGGEPR